MASSVGCLSFFHFLGNGSATQKNHKNGFPIGKQIGNFVFSKLKKCSNIICN
jgi:hypothetical protein